MGNRIALMRAGSLIQMGTAEELYYTPVDIGAARMFADLNEIDCVVAKGRVDTPLGRFEAKGLQEGDAVVMCVRHRDVRLGAASKGRAGRVLATRFLGESALLEIGVEGLDDPIMARVHESKVLVPGTEVGVSVAREGVLVLASQTVADNAPTPAEALA